MVELEFIAKYPFSKEAREFVEEKGVKIDFDSIEKGVTRAVKALGDGEVPKPAIVAEKDLRNEVASYAVARMIVSILGGKYLVNKYAVAESKRAHAFLKTEKKEVVKGIAQQLGIKTAEEGNALLMNAFDYLRSTPRDVSYKLVNRDVSAGLVRLKEGELARVISEAVRKRIETELPLKAKNFPPEVVKAVEEVKEKLKEKMSAAPQARIVASEDYAPCIKKLLEDLKASENLPHTARFCLAVYLLNVTVKAEDVIKIFASAPDYNEQTTRYQVEYAKNKGYKMPGCAMMDLYGLCTQKCGVKNPLSYGKKRERFVKQNESENAKEKKFEWDDRY